MSVLQNINGTLYRMDASDLVQLTAVDTEGILGGTPGATTTGQTLVDQLAADDVQAQTDIGQIKTDLSDYHVYASKNLMMPDIYMLGTNDSTVGASTFNTASAGTGFIAKIDQNTDYVISRVGGNRSRIALSVDVPAAGGACNIINVDNDVTEKSFNSGAYNYIYIYASNTSATYETIKPMVCTAAKWAASHTWVAYWQAMKDGKLDIADEQILGAWNLQPNRVNTQTIGEVTFTHNSDGTISYNSNGSAVSTTREYVITVRSGKIGDLNFLKNGVYYLSGGISSQVKLVSFSTQNNAYASYGEDTGKGLRFTVNGESASADGAYVGLVLQILTGGAVSGIVKPMIALKPNMPYVPYTMTNAELTDAATLKESSCTTTYTVSTAQGGNHLYKKGNTVQMLLALEGVTVAAWTTVATIPSGYRPVNTIMGISMRNSNIPFYVNANGSIQFGSALSNNNASLYLTWLTNE